MTRRAGLLLGALALAGLGAGAAEARLEAACNPGWTRAVIGGKQTCLRAGQQCRRTLDRQYHRYRFHCHAGRLTRFAPPPPPPAQPRIRLAVAGPEQVVFDWTTHRCDYWDGPETNATAIRDAAGRVHLYAGERRWSGASLDAVARDCARVLGSRRDHRPGALADRELPAAVWTDDGTTVHALTLLDYNGTRHLGMCPSGDPERCWYNAIGYAVSTDGGGFFRAAPAPSHLVASVPFPYDAETGPIGIFGPVSVVRDRRDGHWYATIRQLPGAQFSPQRGTCLMRTRDPAEPRSWRAWGGGGAWNVAFVDPFRETVGSPAQHVCQPLFTGGLDTMGESLTWNTYLERFVMVGTGNDGRSGAVYFSTSQDLVRWTAPQVVMEAEMTFTHACGDPDPIAYPTLLDPESPSRSFDVTGQRAYLYFTRFNYDACRSTADRDLVRVPVEFTTGS